MKSDDENDDQIVLYIKTIAGSIYEIHLDPTIKNTNRDLYKLVSYKVGHDNFRLSEIRHDDESKFKIGTTYFPDGSIGIPIKPTNETCYLGNGSFVHLKFRLGHSWRK